MAFTLGPRRGQFLDITEEMKGAPLPLDDVALADFESYDLIYRSLCATMYNYAPMSGHPGGSISSGRLVAALLYESMSYDVGVPDREDADLISYSAGHKALGLYAMWALRDEVVRLAATDLLPEKPARRLRLEDLLGFRRNPITDTPLFRRFGAKPLDGHPTPATPFVALSTGASGVGVASSLGLAFAARDYWGEAAPRIHIIEGEGGLTPGRAAEAMTAAGTASLDNAVMHIDWNQASIDSDHVCRTGQQPGDYTQWDPVELAYFHDWNVILVPDGKDFQQIVAAQRRAAGFDNHQPTAIVYRTIKGWQYGIEGRRSHGAGHALCSRGFHDAIAPLLDGRDSKLPVCADGDSRCAGGTDAVVVEQCYWDTLSIVRDTLAERATTTAAMAARVRAAKARLDAAARRPRPGAPELSAVFEAAARDRRPDELALAPGGSATLRGALGDALGYLNRASHGALVVAAADLLGSTSVANAAKGFPPGYYHTTGNPEARVLSIGGICEDAMSGILAGLSSYGKQLGVGSSYGAFLAPLGHIAARLHAIGNQARPPVTPGPYRTLILVCAHAGLKTGEDGPTHADPQALQLVQGNFPEGTAITLTPWDPQEIWPLLGAALGRRPALIAPFVTRPSEPILDRAALGLAPAEAARTGVYALRRARGDGDGVVVLQGSGVTYAFVTDTLPRLERAGIDLHVYYVASAELFALLPHAVRTRLFPAEHADRAMGITGFTLPTMYKWIRSGHGRHHTLHPFRAGHYLGSGPGAMVIAEAGLDGAGQFAAIQRYLQEQ